MSEPSVALADALRAALATTLPGLEAVHNLNRLSGGANNETWSFDAIAGDGVTPLILRRSPGGGSYAGAESQPGAAVLQKMKSQPGRLCSNDCGSK